MFKLHKNILQTEDFSEELNRQCSIILFPAAFLAIFSWLPYISLDKALFPSINLIVFFRIGLTLIGLIAMTLFFIPKLKPFNYWILYGVLFYLQVSTGIILGLVAGDPAYMGGFSMIILLMPLMPFKKIHALILLVLSMILFFLIGYLNELSFFSKSKQYALINVFFAFITALLIIFVLNFIRESAFNNRKLLKEKNTQIKNQKKELEDAFDKIKTLRGLLPICSHCKSIRDSEGYWHDLELYIQKHSDAAFTHSLCAKCIKKFYPEISDA